MQANDGLAKAQEVMRKLKADFIADMPERLDGLEQTALQLSGNDTFSEVFDELYRKVHSLKGSGGTYGLPVISAICHEMEEGLSSHAGLHPDRLVDRCLSYVDLMRQVTAWAKEGRSTFPEVETTLTALRSARVGQRFTALLVEPSRVNTKLYLGVLKNLPIEFSVVDSAYVALEQLLHSRFDLLITAYETPLLNGAALIAAIRLCRCPNTSTHAILITSNPDVLIPPPLTPNLVLPRNARLAANLLDSVRGLVEAGKAAL